jgi:hypothetical protein
VTSASRNAQPRKQRKKKKINQKRRKAGDVNRIKFMNVVTFHFKNLKPNDLAK